MMLARARIVQLRTHHSSATSHPPILTPLIGSGCVVGWNCLVATPNFPSASAPSEMAVASHVALIRYQAVGLLVEVERRLEIPAGGFRQVSIGRSGAWVAKKMRTPPSAWLCRPASSA